MPGETKLPDDWVLFNTKSMLGARWPGRGSGQWLVGSGQTRYDKTGDSFTNYLLTTTHFS
jgi:hypothetical protein